MHEEGPIVGNFISVSGVTNFDELEQIKDIRNEISEDFKINGEIQLAIGYQFSNKSINKGTQNSRQPKFSEVRDLFKKTLRNDMLPTIHYYTKNKNTILEDMDKIEEEVSGFYIHPIQYNTLPPSKKILEKVAHKSHFCNILKVAVVDKDSPEGGYSVWKGENIEDSKEGNLEPLLKQVESRYGTRVDQINRTVDYVMFDPSHGTGKELDLSGESLAIKFGDEIYNKYDLGLIYAGGINPDNSYKVFKTLNSKFPNRVSIDAESSLRTNGKLDMSLVAKYLENSYRAFKDSSI